MNSDILINKLCEISKKEKYPLFKSYYDIIDENDLKFTINDHKEQANKALESGDYEKFEHYTNIISVYKEILGEKDFIKIKDENLLKEINSRMNNGINNLIEFVTLELMKQLAYNRGLFDKEIYCMNGSGVDMNEVMSKSDKLKIEFRKRLQKQGLGERELAKICGITLTSVEYIFSLSYKTLYNFDKYRNKFETALGKFDINYTKEEIDAQTSSAPKWGKWILERLFEKKLTISKLSKLSGIKRITLYNTIHDNNIERWKIFRDKIESVLGEYKD